MKNEQHNPYFIDQERVEEMYRLAQQDRMIITADGG
jgi:hypothetical protein